LRLFLLPAGATTGPPRPGDEVVLGADETHHLTRVLRAAPGAPVLLADGHGRFLDGELVAVRGGRAVVAVRVVRDDPWERDGPRLVLACGLVKGPRFTWALEKAVELGAHAIRPLRTGRAVVDPGEGRQGRWEAVVRAAAKQAGRSLVPEVHAADTLASSMGKRRPAGSRRTARSEPARRSMPRRCCAAASPIGTSSPGWSVPRGAGPTPNGGPWPRPARRRCASVRTGCAPRPPRRRDWCCCRPCGRRAAGASDRGPP